MMRSVCIVELHVSVSAMCVHIHVAGNSGTCLVLHVNRQIFEQTVAFLDRFSYKSQISNFT